MLKNQRVDVAEGLRERAHEAAWKRRTTTSALVREGLERYVKNGASGARLSRSDPGWGKDRIKFKIDPELWDKVLERAAADGDSVHSVVRRILQRIVEVEKV